MHCLGIHFVTKPVSKPDWPGVLLKLDKARHLSRDVEVRPECIVHA